MKILKIVVNGLPHVKDELNIDFVAQQRVDTYDKEHLFNVFSNIYVNRAISFIGINASGKTTILKTISFVMKLLNNQPINNIESKIIMDDLSKDEDVIITSFFYDGKNVNKLVTVITKKINETDGSEKLIIKDEKLWFKNADKVKTKKTLFVFNENDLEEIRNKNEQYLMDDVSIIVARNKKNNSGIFVCDMLEWTDHNILNVLGRFPKELLTFLDPSIEYLECSLNDKIEYKGIAVKYVDDVKDELKNYKIIIMTANRNVELVGKDLEKLGFISGENFCSMEQFLTEWFWKYKKKACLMEVHSTITSRCTLKCRHCNMFMPYYKEQIDYTAIDILADLELLFRHVDYIVSYRLLGGEPLLNKELADMIELIGQKYGDRIGNIGIITNGTLLPSEKLIEVSKKYDIKYDFSDYTDVVDYKERFENAVQIVSDANLRYSVNRSLRWCDFGFPVNNRMYDFDKVREHMFSCGPIFHGLNDGKYYYCHVSWSADKAKLLKTVPDDYVDLRVLNDDENAKEMILEHSKGNLAKGFVKLCKICGGCGNDNTEFVKAAQQM